MLDSIDQRLHGISTLVNCSWPDGSSSGSGFFYKVLENTDPDKAKKPGYVRLDQLYLVTNRHVLVNDHNQLATSVTFHHRKVTAQGYEWIPITLSGQDLYKRCKFHEIDEVDVALVEVVDLLLDVLSGSEGKQLMAFDSIGEGQIPGENTFPVEVGDDVLVVGYPRGFYDEHSKFPIVKSGIIASRWGFPFSGKRHFLVDAKLFPGSSGSLVISKPTNVGSMDGKIFYTRSGKKEFLFLGIFSGEYYQRNNPIETEDFILISKEGFNLGIVWYYDLIPEIISRGKLHS